MATLKHLPEFNSFDDLKHWVTATGTFQRTIPNGRVVYYHSTSFERIEVWYHQTPVVSWYRHKIILNSGGYITATIARRMNQFLPKKWRVHRQLGMLFAWDTDLTKRGGSTVFHKTLELPYVSA